MLDVKFIRDNRDVVKKAVRDKGVKLDIDKFLELDKERRTLLIEVEQLKRQKNEVSDRIGKMMREKKNPKGLIDSMKTVSQKIAEIEAKVEEINQKYTNFIYDIPNIPHKSVPVGPGPEANKVVKKWGKMPKFGFQPRTHMEIGEILGILDFGRASKIAGTGFALYKGLGAKLERALFNFMLDLHTKKHGKVLGIC